MKRLTQTQADQIAKGVEYQGYSTLRVFEDGKWISPATAAVSVSKSRIDFWNYSWTQDGYQPLHHSE